MADTQHDVALFNEAPWQAKSSSAGLHQKFTDLATVDSDQCVQLVLRQF